MANIPISGTPGDDKLHGTALDDSILGLAGNDTIRADLGSDSLYGGAGGDKLFVQSGTASLHGGAGGDILTGLFDADTLYGGAGDDSLFGLDGDDWQYGGSGNDVIEAGAHGSFFASELNHSYGGDGDDIISVKYNARGDADGGNGIDTIEIEWGSVYTPSGPTTIVLTGEGAAAIINYSLGTFVLTMTHFEKLIVHTGNAGDFVSGGDLDDIIDVSAGADTVFGHAGNDLIRYLSAEAKSIDAGDGTDTCQITSLGGLSVLTVSGSTATDNFGSLITNVEKWDYLGGDQTDVVSLGRLADRFRGGDGADTASGNGGNDHLVGGRGNDELFGGQGADTLSQRGGDDTLYGGADADVFNFATASDFGALIGQFEIGQDQVHVRAALLDGLLPVGVLDPNQLSLEAATGDAAQFVLRHAAIGAPAELMFDTNGAAAGGETLIALMDFSQPIAAIDILIF